MRLLLLSLAFSLIFLNSDVLASQESVPAFERETLIEEYLAEEAKFAQKLSDGRFFKTSIPNGQITPGMVQVEFPKSGLTWRLEADGKEIRYSSGDFITEPGTYTFTVLSPENGIYGEYVFEIAKVSASVNIKADALTVRLSHNYYDERFNYVFENGRAFSANVPNGGITNYGVKLWLDKELICLLTRDGKVVRYSTGEILTEEGYYHMLIISPMVVEAPDLSRYIDDSQPVSGEREENEQALLEELEKELREMEEQAPERLQALNPGAIYQTSFTFRIITRPTRDIPVLNAPAGFSFDTISFNGSTITPTNERYHRLTMDGDYVVSLKDETGGAPNQFITLTADTTPPDIQLSGVTKWYAATKPVSIICNEKDAAITVIHNGIETELRDMYDTSGVYMVTASDTAGNAVNFSFEIKYSPPKTLVLTAVLGALAAIAGYIAYTRRSINIR